MTMLHPCLERTCHEFLAKIEPEELLMYFLSFHHAVKFNFMIFISEDIESVFEISGSPGLQNFSSGY